MSKKILVISTSLRNGSNSDILADEFTKGAIEAGNEVQKVNLKDKTIAFCKGCLACQNTKKCVINDDATKIFETIKDVDVVVWATPVYYYSMSGQMKTLIDRLNPLFVSNYKFKDVYLIATAAEADETAINGTITGLTGWIECLDKTNLKGIIKAVGVCNAKDVNNFKNYLSKAYEMGKAV